MDEIKKIKIVFVLPFMNGGGAEKIVCMLLNHLSRESFEPILVLLKKKGKLLDCLPKDIEIVDLNKESLRESLFSLIKTLKKLHPDIVFSSIGSLNLLIASIKKFFPKKIKFVARETNIVSIKNKDEKYPRLFDLMFKSIYKNFDLIICQSNDMFYDLKQNYGIDKNKMSIINNPVDIDMIQKKSGFKTEYFDKSKYNLLAVGSLSYKKGFDLLIEALSLINDKDIQLTILGEGKQRSALEKLAKEKGVSERVIFKGFVSNPYPFMAEADLFVLSSRYEGFPNVLLEANACKCPVLAFRCKGGIDEIVIEGLNGWSVEAFDVKALAKKIEEVKDIKLDKEEIKKSVERRYALKKTIKRYEKVLKDIYA